MAKPDTNASLYLRRPLYLYDLPPDILSTLSLRTASSIISEVKQTTPEQSTTLNDDGVSTSTSCKLCQASFKDVTEQRQHVRSDLHKYNLKLSLKGLPPVSEATFNQQIGDLDESISGSESSDSGQDEDGRSNDSTLAALLRRQAKLSEKETDASAAPKSKRGPGSLPLLWLSSSKLSDDVGLGVYKAVLSTIEQQKATSDLVAIIRQKQLKPAHLKQAGKLQNSDAPAVPSATSPHFFLCMIGGGHFAAAVIDLAPEIRKGPGGVEERHAIVKAHKTFHRYTTRRKQGGSQSANDNAKGNAHSAGSSIRRYNEAALETDVRDVLLQWKSMIDSAQLLFVRATGTTSRKTLFGPYDHQVLRSNDERLRGFPFSTRRPTQSELLRAFQELTRLKVSTFVEAPAEAPKAELAAAAAKPSQPSKTEPPKRSQEEEAAILHTSQLQNLIRRTKAPGVLLYLAKNGLSPNFEFYPPGDYHHAPTPLHLSASINSPALVTALLMKASADPSVTNEDGKTPYDITGETKVRHLFRVARHELGEDAWDWSAAHVPPAMTSDQAAAIAHREEVAATAAETERRRADLDQIRRDEEKRHVDRIERKAGAGKTLSDKAAAEKTAEERREEESRGLTPEMRQRLERERRARAAEARIKAMSGGK